MLKFVFITLLLTCLNAPSSQAADTVSTVQPAPVSDKPIQMEFDTKRQIRGASPIKMKKAIDGMSLLSDTGDIYSLTGLDIPNDNDTGIKAQKRLAELTEGKKCTLYQTRSDKVGRLNRMNQILAHMTCGNNDVWIQGTLIAEGLARVRTTPENKEQSTQMLTLEQSARNKKIGLWALPMNALLTPITAAEHINSFGIVEGRIYTTAQNRNAIFLNFTSDWKTDFSIGIPSPLRKDFSKLRIDPMSLKGQKIRVRGWIRNYNGAYIELETAEQLEILPNDKTTSSSEPTSPPQDTAGQKAEKIIEGILGESTTQPAAKSSSPQFMHTIGGGTSPTPKFEEPEAPTINVPVAPEVQKPTIRPTIRSPNK